MDEPASSVLLLHDPESIPHYITGKAEPRGDVVVTCNGIDVCRYKDGVLEALACDHPSHGCHPRMRERYAAVHKLMAKLKKQTQSPSGPCPKCAGEGWLATNSPVARHTVILSLMMGMWRGVSFKPRGLKPEDLGDTIGTFLSVQPKGASSSPAGVAASGRAPLNSDKGEGKGKGQEQD